MDRIYEQTDKYIDRLISESTPDRPMWNIEKVRQGAGASWNYIDGCMLTALLELWKITGKDKYFDFVKNFADYFVTDEGDILAYHPEKFRLDDINESRALFTLYKETGLEKYRLAIEKTENQLRQQPRTCEGSFWHKGIYPNQVWLDGIYMAQVFNAMYELEFGSGRIDDVLLQLKTVRSRMRDGKTGLYYHAYDASKKAFWADRATGCSGNFWLRALGWFAAALADLAGLTGERENLSSERAYIGDLLDNLLESIAVYADSETGMYMQIPDLPDREGNYLETSGSCMIAYAMLKGARLGICGSRTAELGTKTFRGIVENRLSFTDEGINLEGICLSAGLGPEDNRRRDGSFEYYMSEPVVKNDAKGVAPLILCYTEAIRRQKQIYSNSAM